MTDGNGFWKVCEALDCKLRIELLRYLLAVEKTEFPCVNELAEKFQVSAAAMSVHLKKLAMVGLVVSKRADRRVYYRAFAATAEGERVLASLRRTFQSRPSAERFRRLREYAHALSHPRRHLIVRCLHDEPGLSLAELARRTPLRNVLCGGDLRPVPGPLVARDFAERRSAAKSRARVKKT